MGNSKDVISVVPFFSVTQLRREGYFRREDARWRREETLGTEFYRKTAYVVRCVPQSRLKSTRMSRLTTNDNDDEMCNCITVEHE